MTKTKPMKLLTVCFALSLSFLQLGCDEKSQAKIVEAVTQLAVTVKDSITGEETQTEEARRKAEALREAARLSVNPPGGRYFKNRFRSGDDMNAILESVQSLPRLTAADMVRAFGLSERSAALFVTSLQLAADGAPSGLEAIGLQQTDVKRLARFEMLDDSAILRVSEKLEMPVAQAKELISSILRISSDELNAIVSEAPRPVGI